jgi:minor extracellular serine protease Vpr
LRRSGSILAAACIVFGLVFAAAAAGMTGSSRGSGGSTDAKPAGGVDQSSAIVRLTGDPVSTYSKTKPAPGKKINFDSTTVKSYRAQLAALRNDFRQWLQTNAPAAKVTGQFDVSVNAVAVQLNGTSLDTLKTAPQVQSASYEGLYYPTVDDPDLGLIHAVQAWGSGGAAGAGKGVVVGVVDTGIDVKHPCFAAPKSPSDGPYTNGKILSAEVFYNKAAQQGLTPQAIQEHGTHVAGTIACDVNTPASVNGAPIPYGISGVAPAAQLRSYNIFPGEVANARSEDILNALDAAASDGVDVINMSIGGGAHGIQDLVSLAVDDLDQGANIVSAVAAGNSGPGHYTVESPGSAARALTAGASTVGHFVTATVSVGGKSFNAATGDFPTVSSNTSLPLAAVTSGSVNAATGLSTACSALTDNLTGKIALISRGVCTFSQKIANAQAAGAAVVLVANNVAGDPISMGLSAGFPTPPPAYMVSLSDGIALKALDTQTATIPVAQSYVQTGKNDIMAGFSSQGPTDVDFRVKPDVVAPGVNVLSSIPVSFCGGAPCFAFFQGTSMATPHLAGSAAVVLSQHPDWTAVQVRSAIVNTADQGVLTKSSGNGLETDVNVIGAGRENLASAVKAAVGLDPVSVSFGSVPSGAGQSASTQVALSTLDGGSGSYTAAVTNVSGGNVSFGASVTATGVTVTLNAQKGATAGDHQGILRIYRGTTEVAHAAVYAFVK